MSSDPMLQKIVDVLEQIRAEEFDYEILQAASDVMGEDVVTSWRPSLSYLPPEGRDGEYHVTVYAQGACETCPIKRSHVGSIEPRSAPWWAPTTSSSTTTSTCSSGSPTRASATPDAGDARACGRALSGAGLLALRRWAFAQGDGEVLSLAVAQHASRWLIAGVLVVFDPAAQVAAGGDGLAVDGDDDVAAGHDGLVAERARDACRPGCRPAARRR